MAVRSRLVEARKRKGLTQEALAARIQRDQSTISRIERGDVVPGADLAQAIMDVLGISLSDVLATDAEVGHTASDLQPTGTER